MFWHADYAPQRYLLCGLVGMPSVGRPIDSIANEKPASDGRRRR